ncbi:MAG: nucleotidyltransferase family protein [Deltaproteobacteria bacterium]|nr:nucleotidyltransferase family protein [Deltaproteobacteria bacterium]
MNQLEHLKNIVRLIPHRYGIKRAGFFGSWPRGEMTGTSDIDILVETGKTISLFEFIRLKHELEDALGRKVDLVEYKTIKPRLQPIILQEELAIL